VNGLKEMSSLAMKVAVFRQMRRPLALDHGGLLVVLV